VTLLRLSTLLGYRPPAFDTDGRYRRGTTSHTEEADRYRRPASVRPLKGALQPVCVVPNMSDFVHRTETDTYAHGRPPGKSGPVDLELTRCQRGAPTMAATVSTLIGSVSAPSSSHTMTTRVWHLTSTA